MTSFQDINYYFYDPDPRGPHFSENNPRNFPGSFLYRQF